MRFTQDQTSSVNLIRGYADGELRINAETLRASVMVAADSLRLAPELHSIEDLGSVHAQLLLDLQPEVVLLGTGRRQIFPPARFGARFLEAGVGFEVMDTGAACRTFNVLVGERRRVVALLIL